MINNPKDITEIIKALDKVTKEQLDQAIKEVEKEYKESRGEIK